MKEDNYNYNYEYIKSHSDNYKSYSNDVNNLYFYNAYLSENGTDYKSDDDNFLSKYEDKDFSIKGDYKESSKTK